MAAVADTDADSGSRNGSWVLCSPAAAQAPLHLALRQPFLRLRRGSVMRGKTACLLDPIEV